jgi:predicted methyltransferase
MAHTHSRHPVLLIAVAIYTVLGFTPEVAAVEAETQDDNARHPDNHHGHANEYMHQSSLDQLIARFEDPQRDAWQQPDTVLDLMGDLKDKVVMDIGSGSGYFSFRLADAGARVICADVDKRFLGYIAEQMQVRQIDSDRMMLRHIPYDSSLLRPSEADIVLIVNTYHHIENRRSYFAEVHAGLKPEGKLVVVDFFKHPTEVGPPANMKLAAEVVINELKAAGFSRFETNRDALPYQYVIQAHR